MTNFRQTVIGVVMVIAVGAASPSFADAIAGCSMPLVPDPESLIGRPWDAQALGLFLMEGGAAIDYTDDEGRPTRVVPHIDLWSGNGSSRPLSSYEGRAVEIPGPGRYPFGRIINGVWDDVQRALERIYPGQQFVVTSVKTLEHEQRLTWSDRQATAALTFRFPTGEGEPEASDHMLSFYFVMADPIEDN